VKRVKSCDKRFVQEIVVESQPSRKWSSNRDIPHGRFSRTFATVSTTNPSRNRSWDFLVFLLLSWGNYPRSTRPHGEV